MLALARYIIAHSGLTSIILKNRANIKETQSVAGKKAGHKRMVTSQVTSESLGWSPSVGSWLLIGKN